MRRLLDGATAHRQKGAAVSALVLIALVTALAAAAPGAFLSVGNATNLAGQLPALFLAAIGQTFVLLGGGFDLSVGAVVSLTSAILSLDLPGAVKVPLAILAAAAVGAVNGVGCVRLRVHPIIMTLATASIVQGCALIVLPVPGGTPPALLTTLSNGRVAGLPAGLFWMVACAALAIWGVHGTRFGLALYATGQDAGAARLSGIAAERTRMATYVISALAACAAGIYLTGRLASGDPNMGLALGLDSVVGAVLGGTLLSGGYGGPIGTIFGVGILGFLNNGLNLAGVSPYWQLVAKGGLLIVAVSLFRRKEAGL